MSAAMVACTAAASRELSRSNWQALVRAQAHLIICSSNIKDIKQILYGALPRHCSLNKQPKHGHHGKPAIFNFLHLHAYSTMEYLCTATVGNGFTNIPYLLPEAPLSVKLCLGMLAGHNKTSMGRLRCHAVLDMGEGSSLRAFYTAFVGWPDVPRNVPCTFATTQMGRTSGCCSISTSA
jgi:hypothetical protein